MQSALKAAAWIAGALLLALIAVFAWGRLRPPTPAQAEALHLLQPAPASTSRNAWATLWLQDVDVPADQFDAVYVQERAHVQAWLAQPQPDGADVTTYVSSLGSQFTRYPPLTPEDNQLLCGIRGDDCLAKLRAQAPAVRELLARQSGRLASLQALARDDVQWDDMPASAYTPLPAFGPPMKLLLTAPALDFVEGRPAQALEAICVQAATVRRLHAHTNSLVGAMVDVAWMDHIEHELAGMLSELPADQAIPPACTQAFAPPTTADVSLCQSMRREYDAYVAIMDAAASDKRNGWRSIRDGLAFSPSGTSRLAAPIYAQTCTADVCAVLLADRQLPSPALRTDVFDLLSNAAGSILARIPAPAYGEYATRNEDYAASLRLMAWLLQNRSNAADAADWRQRLAAALPSLRQGGDRRFRIDPDGRHVRMDYRARRPGHAELVLPLAR